MRARFSFPLAAMLALAACDSSAPRADEPITPDPPAATATPTPAATASTGAPAPAPVAGKWDMVASGEGDGLFFGAVEGEPAQIHLFCANEGTNLGSGMILVNVPSFQPVASEERMSFGSGGSVFTLVADPSGDAQRGGVSGTGPVPGALRAILTGGVRANYGSQYLGTLPAVPGDVADAFVRGCND